MKYHEIAINGPENLFFLMKKSELIENIRAKEIVQNCIQRNAFFAHSENILLAQLASSLKTDRIDAVRTIMDARTRNQDPGTVRLFRVPPLNFKAKRWHLMIKWSDTDVYEPPLVRNLSANDILAIVATPLVVPKFKCHT